MPCPCPVCHPPPGNAPAHFIKEETAQSDFSSLSIPSVERFTKKNAHGASSLPPSLTPLLLLLLLFLPPPSPYSCKGITDGRRHGSPLPGLAVGIGSSGVCPVPARCRGVGPGGKLIRIYWRKRGRRKTLIAAVLHLHTPSRNTGAIFLLRGFVTISWTTNASWHVRVSGIKAAVQCSALRTHTGRILQSPPVARRCSNSLLIASSRRSPTLPPSAQPPSCAQAAALAENVSHISPLLGLCFSGRLLGRKWAQQTDCFPCASCTLADHLSDLMGDRIEDNI